MKSLDRGIDRRGFLTAGLGTVGAVGLSGSAAAAGQTPAEHANIEIVKQFCAAWPGHNLETILGFFAANGSYRMTEKMEPTKGRDALTARIKSIIENVDGFEILDTWARGPMVINERIDRFSNFQLQSWHGVGVFLLEGGKIVEWYDYTISSERA